MMSSGERLELKQLVTGDTDTEDDVYYTNWTTGQAKNGCGIPIDQSAGSGSNNSFEDLHDEPSTRRPIVNVLCCRYDIWPPPFLGLILAAVSSLFFSLCSVIVKWMATMDPMQLAVARFVGVFLPSIPIVIYTGQPSFFPRGKRIMLLLRSFVGTTGLMLSFYAFRNMPLGDASVIVFSVPVFVVVFAYIFLREPFTAFDVVTMTLTLLGVVLITKPSLLFGDDDVEDSKKPYDGKWGAVAAFGAALFGANVYVLIRALKSVHYSVIMLNFGAFALIETTFVTWYTDAFCWPTCGLERFLMVALAVFSFAGQFLLTLSLQVENAGPVSIARSSDIVFAFLWQIFFFDESPTWLSLLGALLVTGSVVLTGLRKWLQSLPESRPIKLKLKFLTT